MQIKNWNRQYDSLLRIKKSGLVVEDVVIKDNEDYIIHSTTDKELKEGKKFSDKQKHFLNKNNEFKALCSNLGGFVNMIYTKNELLFNRINIDKANISRIIYLATYIDFNNRKEGLLIYQPKGENGQFQKIKEMSRADIRNVLGLSDSTFKRFLKDMKDNNLLFEVDGKFYINPKYFNKGDMPKMEDNKSYCRLFIDTIKELYSNCKVSQHKVLTNIYQLVPYIHYANNMICHNPLVLESESIPMTLKDIGKLLNIEDNKGNLNKLVKELESFRVTIEGKEYKVFAYVRMTDKDFFVINPYVIYSGNNVDQLRKVADTYFFRRNN